MADENPLKINTQPEPPQLTPLPNLPEPAQPLSAATNIKRAIAVFMAGISRPDLAAALSQQFMQQDEAAKAEAENRFREDFTLTQAANAQKIQEFDVQRQQIQDIQSAQEAGQRSELNKFTLKKAAREEAAAPEQARIDRQKDLLDIKNLELELKVRAATLARTLRELNDTQDEAHADQLKQVADELERGRKVISDEIDKRKAQFNAAAKGLGGQMDFATGEMAGGQEIAQAHKLAFELDQSDIERLTSQLKFVAPDVPEDQLRGLLQDSFDIPTLNNRLTVDHWITSLNKLSSAVGPTAVPIVGAQVSKALVAGGVPPDQADAAAADIMTGEEAPESALQRGAKLLAKPGEFLGKSVGKLFKPRK